ncbi:hypothetical protein DP067_02345 [Mycoplasmopsis anatis]|uniref:Putative membrane protein P80 n=2 Tax=Mycoplasmopsis anatis TaxID=171279 RepID=F9QCG7_9BACT|nr:hypothetical protein [Mycoplasmopsis anatis]AWX70193.1 hypothetical protein DP067_02345 [Mycoplasmopsis anatis]EGS29554.1 putative membrane protein P80 [Mycoplasmopsis anatis 1340]VEU73360.1 Uncharacterised protein [Mycoplasmopsis anatis]
MAKKQKSFFEKLAEKNDKHLERTKPKIIKKRNTKAYVILGLLGVVVATSIAVPVTVNTVKVNYTPALKDTDKVLEFIKPDNSKTPINVKDIIGKLEANKNINSENTEKIYKEAIFYLYEQEVKASKEFQRLWNESLYPGDTERTDIALKTLDEVRKEQENKIKDLKRQIQAGYGFDNWEKQFNSVITSEQYGNSSTEQEAVDYLIIKSIEKDALRKFTIESSNNSLFKSQKDVNRVAMRDIYYVDQNNNNVVDETTGKPKVMFHKGDKVFTQFVEGKNYFVDQNSNKITLLKSSSFVFENWNTILDYFKEFNKLNKNFVVSTFTIPGVLENSVTGSFKVDKNQYLQFLINSLIEDELVPNYTLIQKFEKLEYYLLENDLISNKAKSNYENYLKLLSIDSSEVKENLGSLGIQNYLTLAKNKDMAYALSTMTNIFENKEHKLPSIELNKLFNFKFAEKTEIRIQSLKDEIQSLKESDSYKNGSREEKIAVKNKIIDKASEIISIMEGEITSMTDLEFSQKISEIYNNALSLNVNGKNFYSIVYSIEGMNNAKLIPTSTGLTIFKFDEVTDYEKLMKLVKYDLNAVANDKTPYFNSLDVINDELKNKNIILEKMLKDKDFNEYLKSNNKLSSTKNSFTDEDIQNTIISNEVLINGNKQTEVINIYSKANDWIKELVNKGSIYNISLINGKVYIDYDKKSETTNLSEKEFGEILYHQLNEYLNVDKGEEK